MLVNQIFPTPPIESCQERLHGCYKLQFKDVIERGSRISQITNLTVIINVYYSCYADILSPGLIGQMRLCSYNVSIRSGGKFGD